MAEEGLSSPVLQFIERYVRSVEQLEIILLLGRNPEQEFRVQDVYNVIMSTQDSVQSWLEQMVSTNLAVRGEGPPASFKFSSSEPAILESVRSLAESYKAYPVRVIESIYRPRQQQQQTNPAQGFADAFRIRKN